MTDPNACNRHLLAHNHVARVEECSDCGCISIHVGPISLRLDASSFEALTVALVEGAGAHRAMHVPLLRAAHERGAA